MAKLHNGQPYYRTIKPLRGWYSDSAIDASGSLTSDVNIGSTSAEATRGLVVHAAEAQSRTDPYGLPTSGPQQFGFEMGWKSSLGGLPMILWSNSQDGDIYNPGVTGTTDEIGSASQIAEWASVLPPLDGGNLVALVCSGAYELESTEFDTAQTYLVGQPLRAVTSNTDADAGKLTNQRGTTDAFNSAGLIQYVANSSTVTNWDSIVAFVSRGKYTNSQGRPVLAYWTFPVFGNR
jgi:hypothetical protein